MSRPIALLTDFGLADTYVGVMKGVILSIAPQTTVIDLCHQVAPQAIAEGAYLLASSYRYFAPDTIFVAVVDPGVGSARRSVALATPHGQFVGPDNGLFGRVAQEWGVDAERSPAPLAGSAVTGVVLTNPAFFLSPISATFHGRDVFAPVAAHLALGTPLSAFGPPLVDLIAAGPPRPTRRPEEVIGQVIHIDHFGNAITDLTAADLSAWPTPIVEAAGQQLVGLCHHYAERPGLLALIGSAGQLEIALSNGSAAATLGLRLGDPVVVRGAARTGAVRGQRDE
jgi:S-adenosylmethionine hydrolase